MTFRGAFSWPLFIPFAAFSTLLLWLIVQNVWVLTRYTRTLGTVGRSEYIESEERGEVGVYQQEVEFRVDGKIYSTGLRVRSNPPAHARGEEIPVYYDAKNPDEARVGTFFDLWLGPMAIAFFWLVFFILWFGALAGDPPSPSSRSFSVQK